MSIENNVYSEYNHDAHPIGGQDVLRTLENQYRGPAMLVPNLIVFAGIAVRHTAGWINDGEDEALSGIPSQEGLAALIGAMHSPASGNSDGLATSCPIIFEHLRQREDLQPVDMAVLVSSVVEARNKVSTYHRVRRQMTDIPMHCEIQQSDRKCILLFNRKLESLARHLTRDHIDVRPHIDSILLDRFENDLDYWRQQTSNRTLALQERLGRGTRSFIRLDEQH